MRRRRIVERARHAQLVHLPRVLRRVREGRRGLLEGLELQPLVRTVLDEYTYDKQKAPQSLDDLVQARLVAGHSERDGFRTAAAAPEQSRLTAAVAYSIMSDPAAGRTLLSADPRTTAPGNIDQIEVLGTAPVPF